MTGAMEKITPVTGEDLYEATEIMHDSMASFNSETVEWETWFHSRYED
jgi:hypothetical protein